MQGPVASLRVAGGIGVLLLLTACASETGNGFAGDATVPGTDSGAAGGGISRTENDLAVDLDPGDGSTPFSWTLVCAGVAEGSHPNAEAACAHLRGLAEPFAPLPTDVACTEQYGGPETARVTGVWGGEPVDLELSRTNGCTISQWSSLGPLLAIPVMPVN
jgi:Subtilisin inhibitor-like